jgi:hypothetical protein
VHEQLLDGEEVGDGDALPRARRDEDEGDDDLRARRAARRRGVARGVGRAVGRAARGARRRRTVVRSASAKLTPKRELVAQASGLGAASAGSAGETRLSAVKYDASTK